MHFKIQKLTEWKEKYEAVTRINKWKSLFGEKSAKIKYCFQTSWDGSLCIQNDSRCNNNRSLWSSEYGLCICFKSMPLTTLTRCHGVEKYMVYCFFNINRSIQGKIFNSKFNATAMYLKWTLKMLNSFFQWKDSTLLCILISIPNGLEKRREYKGPQQITAQPQSM